MVSYKALNTKIESKRRRKNRNGKKVNKLSEKNSRTMTLLWRWLFHSHIHS